MEHEKLAMKVFFTWVWKFKPKYCECGCGEYLSNEFSTAMMDHTLEKRDSEYPECKFSKSNIRFYRQEHHHKKTSGFPTNLQKRYKEIALENYDLLVNETNEFIRKFEKLTQKDR